METRSINVFLKSISAKVNAIDQKGNLFRIPSPYLDIGDHDFSRSFFMLTCLNHNWSGFQLLSLWLFIQSCPFREIATQGNRDISILIFNPLLGRRRPDRYMPFWRVSLRKWMQLITPENELSSSITLSSQKPLSYPHNQVI